MAQPESSYYDADEIRALGFAQVGEDVRIDRTCRFFGINSIRIGSFVRIDAFALITSGGVGVHIGNHVHVAAGAFVFGGGGVILEDFTGLSSRVCVYSTNDDYSGGAMTGPTVPDGFRNVKINPVAVRKHALVGAGSIVLPGVEIGIGAAVGALSLVRKSVPEFAVVAGNPLKHIGNRNRRVLDLEREFLATRCKDTKSA